MNTFTENNEGDIGLDFETLVSRYYGLLYKFAFSITRSEADACDLTQQTFYVCVEKGTQLRDRSKVKSWLFTTLHRIFLHSCRRQKRFPHFDLDSVIAELPNVSPPGVNHLDSERVLEALRQVDEVYQVPVALFYLDECSYKDIAKMLDVPIGTVKSRIARGITQLKKIMGQGCSQPLDTRSMHADATPAGFRAPLTAPV
jgi:RNA polymerase sigma-70 factor (ECF subfamily)